MSTMEETEQLDETIFADAAEVHLRCCEHEQLFCGAPFHPELLAVTADDDSQPLEAIHEACREVMDEHVCNNGGITHMHCPVTDRACMAYSGAGLIIIGRA